MKFEMDDHGTNKIKEINTGICKQNKIPTCKADQPFYYLLKQLTHLYIKINEDFRV